MAWISLIPLLFALENKNPKERFIIGYVFGVAFFSGILYWIATVSIPGTVILILLLSFAPSIFCLYRIKGGVYDLLAVASLWVLTEFLRANLLSGFPWTLLAHTQYLNLSIIQIADITGAYGVSFLIVAVNFCIYAILRKFQKRITYTIMCMFILLVAFLYGFYHLRQNYTAVPLSIAVVQGNIPQSMKWDPAYQKVIRDKHELITLDSEQSKPDLVIWPETSLPGYLEEGEYVYGWVRELAKKMDAFLLIGAVKEKDSEFYNSAYFISRDGKILNSYDKIHLVPFGEYIPLEGYMPWFRDIIDKPIGTYDFGNQFTLFKIKAEKHSDLGKSIVRNIRFYNFGVLICFEDIFPELAREFVKSGAEFLVNITNDAWFGDTSAPYQHVQASVFRAVENRVPVVRSANTGVSCFINQKGRITGSVSIYGKETFVEGYKQMEIYPTYKRSIYTALGDVFVYLCFAFFAFSLVLRKYDNKIAKRIP